MQDLISKAVKSPKNLLNRKMPSQFIYSCKQTLQNCKRKFKNIVIFCVFKL